MKSDIGFAKWVLTHGKWGSTSVKGRPRSQDWWKKHLEQLIKETEESISAETLVWLGESNIEIPIPFEIEMGMPDLNYDNFIQVWQQTFSDA